MADTTIPPTAIRTAYIRTVIDKAKESEYYESCWANLRMLLWSWVGQKVHNDPAGTGAPRLRSSPPPGLRHHYIIGHSNPFDAFVLDWLLENSKPDSWRMCRDDFEVFLSKAQMKDPAYKGLLQKLELERVKVTVVESSTPTEFETEDICDGVMLTKSDYMYSTVTLFDMATPNATTLKSSHNGTTTIGSRTKWDIPGDHVHTPTANPTLGKSITHKTG
ncbi:peptidase A1 [Fusarium sp. NRRL 52700]|nr:peptidase A1 [Fusarium sp. NRRL 52700]